MKTYGTPSEMGATQRARKQNKIARLGIELVEVLDAQDAAEFTAEERAEAERIVAWGCIEDCVGYPDNGPGK